jgi:hypothetical protein
MTIVFSYGSAELARVGLTLAAPMFTLETQKSYPEPLNASNPKLITSFKIVSQIIGLGLYCNFVPFLPTWLAVASIGILLSWPTALEIITNNSGRFFKILEFLSIFLIVSVGYLAPPVYLFLCNLIGLGIVLFSEPKLFKSLFEGEKDNLQLIMGIIFIIISGIGLVKDFLPFILSLIFIPIYWISYAVLCLVMLVSCSEEVAKLRNKG